MPHFVSPVPSRSPLLDEDELFSRAVRAHLAHCKREGLAPTQPQNTRDLVDSNTIELSNIRGTLGFFRATRSADGRVIVRRVGLSVAA